MGGYYLFKTLEREYGSNENNRATKVNDVTMSLLHKHYPTVKEHRWQNNTTSTLRVLIPGIGLLGLAHCLLVWFQSSSCATTNKKKDNDHHHLMIDGCDLSLSSLLLGTGMLSMLHTAPTVKILIDTTEGCSDITSMKQLSILIGIVGFGIHLFTTV